MDCGGLLPQSKLIQQVDEPAFSDVSEGVPPMLRFVTLWAATPAYGRTRIADEARQTRGSSFMTSSETHLEEHLIEKLRELKYEYRDDIRDRAALERNFRERFQALNRVTLTDGEFQRLLDEIITPDVFTAAKTVRGINSFTRDDGTPLNYTLVNIKDWCKNSFEAVNQLRINTDNSHHRYDVMLLINGVPAVQIELKTLGINPRRAMEQIVDYKNDPGNGYTRTLLCFVQLFVVSNRDSTWYFANNNARHFSLQRRRAVPPPLPARGRRQHQDHPPRQLRREVSRQVHARADDQPLHGPHRQ